MANKLNTYKFVNPGSSATKDPKVAAGRKQVLATNRIGGTLNGISLIVKDLNLIQVSKDKQDDKDALLKRREERRKDDSAAEDNQEVGNLKKKPKVKITSKLKKASKGAFGFLADFLSPITNILLSFGGAVLSRELLKWMSDPKNREQLTEFVDKTLFVVGKLWEIASGLTTTLLDGLGGLFGEDSTFFERLEGLGKVILGIIGLKYLMNPFSLITDILGLLSFIGDTNVKPKGGGAADDIAEGVEQAARKGSKKRAAQVAGELGEQAGRRYLENTKKFGAEAAESVFERGLKLKDIYRTFGPEAATNYKKILKEKGENAARVFLSRLEDGKSVKNAIAFADKLVDAGQIAVAPLEAPIPKKPGFFGRISSGLQDFGSFVKNDVVDDVRKRAVQGGEMIKKRITSFPSAVQNGFEWAGQQYNNLSKGAKANWAKVVSATESAGQIGSNLAASAGNTFNNLKASAGEFITKKFITPLRPFIDPVVNTFQKVGGMIRDNIAKIPGYEYITKFLSEKGITLQNALGQQSKFGKRAATIIPVIGGIANLIFAYDKAANGDGVGALIEGTAGVLDIATAFGGPAAPLLGGIALGLDLYSLARDFVPAIQEGENAMFEKLGLKSALDSVNGVLSKLPNLGELWGMITGNKLTDEIDTTKKPEELDKKAAGGEISFAKSMIKIHEGSNIVGGAHHAYNDSKGYPTIGYGHLIQPGDGYSPHSKISQGEADKLFDKDFNKHLAQAKAIPGYNKGNAQQKAALIDLAFNMGGSFYKEFPKFAAAVKIGDWKTAAVEIQDSDYYSQVGRRGPVIRDLLAGKGVTASYLSSVSVPSEAPQQGSEASQQPSKPEPKKAQPQGPMGLLKLAKEVITRSIPLSGIEVAPRILSMLPGFDKGGNVQYNNTVGFQNNIVPFMASGGVQSNIVPFMSSGGVQNNTVPFMASGGALPEVENQRLLNLQSQGKSTYDRKQFLNNFENQSRRSEYQKILDKSQGYINNLRNNAMSMATPSAGVVSPALQQPAIQKVASIRGPVLPQGFSGNISPGPVSTVGKEPARTAAPRGTYTANVSTVAKDPDRTAAPKGTYTSNVSPAENKSANISPAENKSPSAPAKMLAPTTGASANYTMQKQQKSGSVIPLVIPKLVPVGSPAPINTGGGGTSYSAPNRVIQRLK